MRVLIVEDYQDGGKQLERCLIRPDGLATAEDLRADHSVLFPQATYTRTL